MTKSNTPILSAVDLHLNFQTETGTTPVLRGVSFDLYSGESLGIVGESGSGKTVTCLSLLKLLPSPPADYRRGEVHFHGLDLQRAGEAELRKVRGGEIAFIFQEAMSALNPVLTIGDQVQESLLIHTGMSKPEAKAEVVRLFEQVGIPDAGQRYAQYPHQLSGGLQQRVMIAMALACRPEVVIADEPTTALDVTIQVQIVELLKELQQDRGMSLIFISHDLGVIAEICQRVLVMYAGQIVESGPAADIFDHPQHPYTQQLIRTIPRLDSPRGSFEPIAGQIPSPENLPGGCAFHPRCAMVMDICRKETPRLLRQSPLCEVRCWLHDPSHKEKDLTGKS